MATIRRRAGRYVPAPEGWTWLADYAHEAAGRVWCWREFSLPVLAVLAARWTGHHTLALIAGTLMVSAFALLLLIRPSVVGAAWRRCRARSRRLRRQVVWPGVCRGLGWARQLPDGAMLIPDLLSWDETDEQATVCVRPLPEQAARSWNEMADALRRLLGGANVQWRESHGALTMLVSRTSLPDQLIWCPGLSDMRRIVIGQRHGGSVLALDVQRTPHVLVAGATGSGKGGAIRCALASALEAGWQAIVIDPKESGEYRWVDGLGVPVLCDIRAQVDALRALDTVRQSRQALIKAAGADAWHELHAEDRTGWRPLLVVIDEAADLLVPIKGRSEYQREHAAEQQEAARLIAQLARKGRSAGVHVIVAIQRPDTAQLGDQGGALRNNLTARLALGTLDSEGVRMLGVPSGDPVTMTLDGTPGRGICVGFGEDPRPSACQIAWCDQQQAHDTVRPPALQGLGRIEPCGTPVPALPSGEEVA